MVVDRVKHLGAIVVRNPDIYAAISGLLRERLGAKRAAAYDPLRSLLEVGVPLVIATDGVMGSPLLNPHLNIMYAVTYPGKPNEALTREQAVVAYTRTAAFAEFAEKSCWESGVECWAHDSQNSSRWYRGRLESHTRGSV